jgi:hypothetical protein
VTNCRSLQVRGSVISTILKIQFSRHYLNVADAGRDVSANRLAAFLSRYADRHLAGFKFVNRKGHAATKLWRLEKLP